MRLGYSIRKASALLLFGMSLFGVLSCSEEVYEADGYGYLSVQTACDGSLELIRPESKAAEQSGAIMVSVTNASGMVVLEQNADALTEPVKLRTGRYHILATSGTDGGAAAFDSPFYSGSTDVIIKNGQVCQTELILTLADFKVTAAFSQEILDNFTRIALTVTNGEGELVFSSETGTLNKEGYFGVTGTLSWTLELENADGEVYKTMTDTYTDVKAAQHYNLSFSLGEKEPAFGGGAVTVILDDSMNVTEHELVLDFTVKDIPTIEASFPLESLYEFFVGQPQSGTMSIVSPVAIQNIVISHDNNVLSGLGIGVSTELIGADTETSAALASAGVNAKVSELTADIDFSALFAKLPVGRYSLNVFVKNVAGGEASTAVIVKVKGSVDMTEASPWARFAYVKGNKVVGAETGDISFQIRTLNGDWTDAVSADFAIDGEGVFTARVLGLQSATSYEVRAVTSTNEATESILFTTEAEEYIPNMNFDAWYQDGKAWYPNADANNFWWDSANGGTAGLSIIPTNPETSIVAVAGEGKKAAKLESLNAPMVGLAAGNIYTGKFVKAVINITNPGAELDWGVPFTARPLALKGYYHYLPVAINAAKDPYTSMSGKEDVGQIQVILTDWDKPFRINTQTKTFVNVDTDANVIAYGTMDLSKTTDYQEFEIKLDYRDLSRKPKYAVIVGSASKYGDYFTGGKGSVLYLDEFTFEYDPQALQ